MSRDRDRRIAGHIERWFAEHARELPWRTAPREPYASLVSELMLQQTQVSRVIEKFGGFMARFPTVGDLADADEADVLAAWSGLGYYRRARALHAAARQVVERHEGEVPSDAGSLLALAGVGRYTAGAIASIVFGERAPIVDGNVARVVLRIDGVESSSDDPAAMKHLWKRAQGLVDACDDPALLNEGLMELGAVVCTPKSPGCGACPVRRSCAAKRLDAVDRIPVPKARTNQKEHHIAMAIVRDARGRVLVERRPDDGLWAGLWHGPSLESDAKAPGKRAIERHVGLVKLRKAEEFRHVTTHRIVRIVPWIGEAEAGFSPVRGEFRAPDEVEGLALSSAHRRLLLSGGESRD
ncbi:MAG: A/G-specific adenine glycosylase [Phycisphaerales bacterium]